MINLLSSASKAEIRAARTNVLLVRYLSILGGAIFLLAALSIGTYLVLVSIQTITQEKVTNSRQSITSYDQINKDATQFRNDLATAKTILDGEITYSKLIYSIADSIPNGVIIDNLSLDPQTLGSKVTMSANAKSYATAINMKETFTKRTDLYSNVYFETLSYSPDAGSGYPIKVSLSVVINKEALK